jgi:hypothetical protein
MATLYWGGGTGTWDGFTTTNWYTDLARTVLSTRAPSAEDDVVFDSTSNATAYTVTISGNLSVCRDLTISGPASGNVTIAGSGQLYIYGSLSLPATGITRTFTGAIFYYGTGSHTITTNGVTLASTISFSGIGTYTLQDALNNGTSAIRPEAGTFDTNGKNLTCGTITATAGTTAGTLTLGASTVSATLFNANAPITVNAGTSNITLSNASASIGGGTNYTGNTFYNVTFSNGAIGTSNFYGTNTFNNLTLTTVSAARVSNVILYGNQTVNGTLTITGQSSVNRYFVQSNITGTTRTLTVATVAALTDVDFRDITVAGASSPWSGTRLGDCGGNTNITFPAAKTVYWNGTAGGAWSGNFWATGSGGAVSTANFPLAQDTAIIDDTGLNTGSSISDSRTYNVKTITSTKTNAYTLGITPILYGDLTLTASTTTSSLTPTFAGRVTQNLTSAGNTISLTTFNGYNASVKLADNTTLTAMTITSGGLDTNNKNFTVTTTSISTTNVGAFTLTLGSSTVSITNNFVATSATAPTMTVSAGTSTITLSAGSQFGFEGQTLTWYNVAFSASSATVQVFGINTFNNLTFTATAVTGVQNITFTGNQTINGTLALGGGTSAIQRLQVISNVLGTARTITAATVTGMSDVDFRDITGAGAGSWSGTRIGDMKGNSGITFTAGATKYWNLAGTQNWSATGWATGSGGTPAVNNFPLPQDDVVFDDTGAAGTVTVNANWNVKSVNLSARTSAMTLSGSTLQVLGDFTNGSGLTVTGLALNFVGRTTQTVTSAAKTFANWSLTSPSGTLNMADAWTSNSSVNIAIGTFNTQNYNLSVDSFAVNPVATYASSTSRTVNLGTSTVTATGTTSAVNIASATNLTFNASSSTINLSSSSAKTFNGGGQTFGTVSSTGGTTNALTITGSNTFTTFTNTARTYLIFTSGTTQTATTFSYSGASGAVVRWYTTIPGRRATLSTSSSAVGANSVDGGNNSGLTFTGSSPDYFYVKDIALIGAAAGATGKFFLMFGN